MEQRAYNIRLLLVSGLLTWPTLGAAAPCYDLSKGQPARLTGTLDYVVFPGPPNYKNVQKGDTPEPSFVLRLAHPICIQGDKSADPKISFRAVQLVKTAKVEGKLKPLLHDPVAVTLQHPAPDRAHHEAPLFAWVTDIVPTTHEVKLTKARAPVPASHQMEATKVQATAETAQQMNSAKEQRTAAIKHPVEFTKEHDSPAILHQVEFTKDRGSRTVADQMDATEPGTGATTVRTFYARLADGQGDRASAMVVPEKRAHGPFSADELSRFYGHLEEPIRLVNVERNGPGEFLVHYRYAAWARECDGRARVRTVVLEGKTYVKSIDALDGC